MFVEIQKQLAEVFHKKSVWKSFVKFPRKNLYQCLLQTLAATLFLKRDSGTSVFLWIWQDLSQHLYKRTLRDGCFWRSAYCRVLHVICLNFQQNFRFFLNMNFLYLLSFIKRKKLAFPEVNCVSCNISCRWKREASINKKNTS